MVKGLLIRGMLAGLVAAVLAMVVAWVFGEPQVEQAIAFEEQRARAAGEAAEPELVSRAVQKTAGLATAVGGYGVAIGGLFALAFAAAYGRIGPLGARTTSALVAAGGLVTVVLVPFLKYPANPPAVGNADTVGHRTALYFGLILIAVLAAVGAVYLARQLAPRYGSWNGTLLAAAAFIVVIAAAYLALPPAGEPPAGFPASLLWHFRIASLATQTVLWATLGLLFGPLAEGQLRRRQQATPQATPAAR